MFRGASFGMDKKGNKGQKIKEEFVDKPKQSRYTWTSIEEKALIDSLKEIIEEGWRSDNGFRAGYLNVLETKLREKIPGLTLIGAKHINSKITVWKRTYGNVQTSQCTSGFGWNDSTHQITVESDNVWELFAKANPELQGMRYKTYPYYNDWCDIFGKDRATGEHATTFTDAVTDVLLLVDVEAHEGEPSGFEGSSRTEQKVNSIRIDVDDDDFDVVDDDATSNQSNSANKGKAKQSSSQGIPKNSDPSPPTKRSKTSTSSALTNEIKEVMGSFLDVYKDVVCNLVAKIGDGERDRATEKTAKVYEIIGNMENLTQLDRFKMATRITESTKIMDLFLGMPTASQSTYVAFMMTDKL